MKQEMINELRDEFCILEGIAPIEYEVINESTESQKVIFFGKSMFLLTSNFGSDSGVTIKPLNPSVTYLETLAESALFPFLNSYIHIIKKGDYDPTLKGIYINLEIKDTKRNQSCTTPIMCARNEEGDKENKTNTFASNNKSWVDSSVYYSMNLEPNSQYRISFGVKQRLSLQEILKKLNFNK